jgi:MFS family permease
MAALGMNGTAIMAALPTMRHDLALNPAQLEWAINGYLVVSAACIIPGGKAGDQFGARRISVAGLALFALASAVVATAPLAAALLAGRALQGLAAALAVPGTLATVSAAAAPDQRASAIGAWAGFLMLGFSLGPLIGGVLTHYLDWRVIFWVSAASMLVATAGFAGVGAPTARNAQSIGHFDLPGFMLLSIAMTTVVSALHALPALTSAPVVFLGLTAVAIVTFVALLRHEARIQDPLIDLDLFRQRAFIRAVLLASIAMACILALLLFYNLAAQDPSRLALTPVAAGVSLLPMSGGLLIFAFSAPKLVQRLGARNALTAGTLLVAIAAVVIAVAVWLKSWAVLLLGLLGIGAGLALPYATAPRLALASLPGDQVGAGSGLLNACTFLGGSIGVAAGAVAFALGGLSATMAMIVVLALAGARLCHGLPGRP